ncbi:hypothetical protein GCM10022266_27290 [Agrococcus terreus]
MATNALLRCWGLHRPLGPQPRERSMKGVLLWLVGIPIPFILLLYLFTVL